MNRISRVAKAAILPIACLLALGSTARADDGLVVSDASVLKYGVQDNKVYFRNLNEVNTSWLPCCYNYWIDISTDNGRAQFSAFLTAKASHARIAFWIGNKATPSAFAIVGDF